MSIQNKQLVSILIPTFNGVRFVARAIETALSQTYEATEIVVVDNASTDGTFKMAKKYASKYANVRVYQNGKNIGPVRNWRRCAQKAIGQYACLLFSDDWYEETFVEETLFHMQDLRVGFVYSAVTSVKESEHGETSRLIYCRLEEGRLPVSQFVEQQLCFGRDDVPLSPSCAMFRLADLRSALFLQPPDKYHIGYMEHGAGPDLLVYLLTATRYPYFAYIDMPLVSFLAHDKNLSRQKRVNLAYALAKAWFACRYGASFKEIDLRKFRAAHLWRLWRLRSLRLYSSSLEGDERRYDLAWRELFRYLLVRVRGLMNS